jgi:hypothetical protein
LNFSSIHDGRFASGHASSDPIGRAQSMALNKGPSSVPKLDLSLARTASGSSLSGAFGAGGGVASFEEAQTSARSFGEDFDIQPPAPNRRDMERLRALREQKPLPSSNGSAILESSSAVGGGTPVSALRRHAEDEVTTEMSTKEEAETPKLKELRFLADHISHTRATSLPAAPAHRPDEPPAAAAGSAAQAAHRPAADTADRPADRPAAVSLAGGSGVAARRSWDGGAATSTELGAASRARRSWRRARCHWRAVRGR